MPFPEGFWVHDMPARSIEQVIDYLSDDDPHTRSKVQWFDSKKFVTIIWEFPIRVNDNCRKV